MTQHSALREVPYLYLEIKSSRRAGHAELLNPSRPGPVSIPHLPSELQFPPALQGRSQEGTDGFSPLNKDLLSVYSVRDPVRCYGEHKEQEDTISAFGSVVGGEGQGERWEWCREGENHPSVNACLLCS